MRSRLKSAASLAAAISALIAAALWFWSAKIPVGPTGAAIGGPAPYMVKLFDQQASISSWAAFFAGVSALLQAFALVL